MITDINQLDLNKRYTYADYLTWQFKERVELIKGKIFKMPPAPSKEHQRISMNISGIFWSALKGKKCSVFAAPFDVRLPVNQSGNEIATVVQPDISIICDPSKLDDKGCLGAPDLIVEILSPGNSKREVKDKFDLYEQNGVKYYWVVFPAERVVQIYHLAEGQYKAKAPLADGDEIRIEWIDGLQIKVEEIFD